MWEQKERKSDNTRVEAMQDLRRLWLESGPQQIELPLKPSKAEHYVFCKVEATRGKIQFLRKELITRGICCDLRGKMGRMRLYQLHVRSLLRTGCHSDRCSILWTTISTILSASSSLPQLLMGKALRG
ncbi:hypothetical protein BDV23DRAFT_102063 [Aspergillus alliaceus]|uniref:Uncharacterized protein n=1 Tax=Petromyces alliaceus TaxID=209559 RepID=A0A5N7C4N9_PETAA|nr:hypothetical protein BDV23DRAFT_102063 [Aspergillus alliaceus]